MGWGLSARAGMLQCGRGEGGAGRAGGTGPPPNTHTPLARSRGRLARTGGAGKRGEEAVSRGEDGVQASEPSAPPDPCSTLPSRVDGVLPP